MEGTRNGLAELGDHNNNGASLTLLGGDGMIPDSTLMDRDGFCIHGWQVDKTSKPNILSRIFRDPIRKPWAVWHHTVFMEVPAFTNYKTGDSLQVTRGRFTATKSSNKFMGLIFCEFKDLGVME